ncbi:MAG: hypothetical protein N3D20_01545 [Candidatus Pacearchaeota archaeon]|nr:hypothetical protein [Candidatus Pacearchaeota archaeon]
MKVRLLSRIIKEEVCFMTLPCVWTFSFSIKLFSCEGLLIGIGVEKIKMENNKKIPIKDKIKESVFMIL